MKEWLKDQLVGTPLESPARALHQAYLRVRRGSGSWESEALRLDRVYNAQTRQVMERIIEPDSNCVDVGCHRGSVLRQMLELAPGGTHFAFEPLPRLYRGLCRSFAGRRNVNIFDCALSDREGITEFVHVVSNPAYSGFRRRTYEREHEKTVQISVRTARLDDVVPVNLPIAFVKVDVEGAEWEVFRGAVETIRRSQPVIVFEHGLGSADHYGTEPGDVYDLLAGDCGLSVFLMDAWLKRGSDAGLSRAEFADEFASGRNYYFMAGPR